MKIGRQDVASPLQRNPMPSDLLNIYSVAEHDVERIDAEHVSDP